MTRILIVALGGAAGSVTRYLVGGWAAARWGTTFPIGTFLVNVSGSFLIGLFATVATDRFAVPPAWRLLIAIGFLGGFTTFSTFQYESLQLLMSGSFLRAAANLLGSVAAGLVAVWLGMVVGRLL